MTSGNILNLWQVNVLTSSSPFFKWGCRRGVIWRFAGSWPPKALRSAIPDCKKGLIFFLVLVDSRFFCSLLEFCGPVRHIATNYIYILNTYFSILHQVTLFERPAAKTWHPQRFSQFALPSSTQCYTQV